MHALLPGIGAVPVLNHRRSPSLCAGSGQLWRGDVQTVGRHYQRAVEHVVLRRVGVADVLQRAYVSGNTPTSTSATRNATDADRSGHERKPATQDSSATAFTSATLFAIHRNAKHWQLRSVQQRRDQLSQCGVGHAGYTGVRSCYWRRAHVVWRLRVRGAPCDSMRRCRRLLVRNASRYWMRPAKLPRVRRREHRVCHVPAVRLHSVGNAAAVSTCCPADVQLDRW